MGIEIRRTSAAKRLLVALLACLALIAPANATNLLSVTLTSPVSVTATQVLQLRRMSLPTNVTINCIFTHGSGGTSADAYIQTSLDGGTTWIDVAQCHALTTTFNALFNLSNEAAITSPATPTDGTLTDNTAVSGIIGNLWRVKYKSSGTYGGSTTFVVNAFATNGLTQ